MGNKAVLLASLGFDYLEVWCTRCPRRGRYWVASLMAEHGADIGLPALASILAADCPQQAATDLSQRSDWWLAGLRRVTTAARYWCLKMA